MNVRDLESKRTIEFGCKKNILQKLPEKSCSSSQINVSDLSKTSAVNLKANFLNTCNKTNVNVISFCGSMTQKGENRQGQEVVDLKGEWEYLPYNTRPELSPEIINAKWPTMNMPSNWFLLGKNQFPKNFTIDADELPGTGGAVPIDKEKGFNYNGTMYYKKNIDFKKQEGKSTFIDLGGVDYYGEIFVNGKKIPYGKKGYHEGFFQPWSVDITKALKDGTNQIIIKVSDPELPVDMGYNMPEAWPKMQSMIKGVLKYHDARPGGVTKRGQECGTGGIVEGIHLRTNDGTEVSKLMVNPSFVTKESAVVKVKFRVENFTDKPKNIIVDTFMKPHNFTKENQDKQFEKMTVTVPPGGKEFSQSIKVDKPELWWCRDLGKPNLYNLNIKLLDAENPQKTLESRSTNFGIRKIEKNILDPSDPTKKWGFKLNGENVYVRGSNYLSTQWMSMADENFYKKDIDLMKEANLNAVRVHAKIDRPEFYKQADENGIMVWQDFPLQWGYTDSKEFHQEAVKQAGDMAEELFNHPSIIYYCMHNESPHAQGWMEKAKDNPKQNLKLDEKLVTKVKQIDDSRVVGRDSGTEDGHHYPGWYVPIWDDYLKKGFTEYSFVTEYGAQALSSPDLLKRMLKPDTLKLEKSADYRLWEFGNFQPNPNGVVSYVKDPNPTDKYNSVKGKVQIQRGKNIEEFVENSQAYQAAIVKFFTEKQRQVKGKPSTGVVEFQFTDNWPAVATWSKIDNDRKPKQSFYALKDAMQPLLPSITYNLIDPDAPIGIKIVNDFHKDLPNHTLYWQIGDEKPKSMKLLNEIKSDGVIDVKELGKLTEVTKGNKQLKVWIEDANGKKVGENHLCKDHFVPPKLNADKK